MALIQELIRKGWLKTPRIIKVFQEIKRIDFLPADVKNLAELDEALPIGFGQTISQPLVVAFMLELLQPQEGDKILDIGSGSGWTSVLLGQIVGATGKVIAIELIPELKDFGEKNAQKYGKNIEFICANASKGYEKEAPYDRILASAASREVPAIWKKQLKIGGRIVAPMGSSIWQISKAKEGIEEIEYPGFIFVPLIEE